jgi:hypothetical protein
MSGEERRSSKRRSRAGGGRAAPTAPVSLLFPDAETFGILQGGALAAGGLHLPLEGRLRLGQVIELSIGFARERSSVEAKGELLWAAAEPGPDGKRGANLRLDDEALSRIRKLVGTPPAPAPPLPAEGPSTRSRRLRATTRRRGAPGPATERRMIAELDRFLAELERKVAPEVPEPVPPEPPPAAAGKKSLSPSGDGNLATTFDSLSQVEQMRLALGGNRAERGLVLRKGGPNIYGWLVQNPKVTESEIAEIASLPSTRPVTLDQIARRRDWMRVDAIRIALATNPATPPPLALRIVPTLPEPVLRRLAKNRDLKGPVDALARRILQSRAGGSK